MSRPVCGSHVMDEKARKILDLFTGHFFDEGSPSVTVIKNQATQLIRELEYKCSILAATCRMYLSVRAEQALGGVKSGARKRICKSDSRSGMYCVPYGCRDCGIGGFTKQGFAEHNRKVHKVLMEAR